MTYAGLESAHSQDEAHLGGNIKIGDPYTYSPTVWNYVIDRFCVRSVLDVGSGSGNASFYFHKKGLMTLAVDGYRPNVETSLYPAIGHDLTKGPVLSRVDLVHCQEVVEHIEEKYLDFVLSTLTNGKIILMTHALPGQDGYHHVNLQPPGYWISHLEKRGCLLLAEDTRRIRAMAEADGAYFIAKTGMLFVNTARYGEKNAGA